jgi:hypothetical protein
MRLILIALVGALAVALAAALTRPDEGAFRDFASARLLDRIARADVTEEDSPLGAAALALCKLKPADCADLIADSVEIEWREGPFTVTASADWNGRGFSCTGAFTRFWCREVGGRK